MKKTKIVAGEEEYVCPREKCKSHDIKKENEETVLGTVSVALLCKKCNVQFIVMYYGIYNKTDKGGRFELVEKNK